MFDIKNVLEPCTLSEAVKLYSKQPSLKVIAGGTDVLIHLHHGKIEGIDLLSLKNVNELKDITILEDGSISIGSMVSFSQIFKSDIIKKHIPILGEAAVSMGGPQIRNMATVGGNVCNGAVSGDSAPTLFTLNAVLKLVNRDGGREVFIQDFYEGPGRVKLKEGEILSHIVITKDNYQFMSGKYIKFSNRKAMDIAMISVAAVLTVSDAKFKDLRIGLGVSAPTPIRCTEAETYAINKTISNAVISEISKLALKSAKPRDSWRGSKAYREHLIEVLTTRAIKEALERSGVSVSD